MGRPFSFARMHVMRVMTWNINSLRLRMDLLRQICTIMQPDIVCLQEIKVEDRLFPLADCQSLGFPHVAFKGMKGYNGVAILSKLPLDNIRMPQWCDRDDCRHLVADVAGIELHNFYVPAGGDIPNPQENPKFAHKLDFLRQVTAHFAAENPNSRKILLGDLNIAPLEQDVWSHKQLLSVVSHTPIEVDLLTQWQKSLNWYDTMRHFVPPQEKLFTWWSYRSPDWTRNDRGRRLDHIWVTPSLAPNLQSMLVARECRAWTQPSDHVPVMIELSLE